MGVYLHPWRRESISRLRPFAAPPGSAPSLSGTVRAFATWTSLLLRDEFTFGLNRIYLTFPALGFQTSCLVSVNDLVIEQCIREMQALPYRLLSWRSRRFVAPDDQAVRSAHFLYTTYESPRISRGMPAGDSGRAPRSPTLPSSWLSTWVSSR